MNSHDTWEECERRFREADAHKPEGKRFERWKVSQTDAFHRYERLESRRMLLFFPTGEGKSKTALACIKADGFDRAIVIAPPKLHAAWVQDAKTVGVDLLILSIEKLRQPDYRLPLSWKGAPFLVDEWHKLGGHGASGFTKFERVARHSNAPVIGMSATPNYNDAERVFTCQAVFDPNPTRNFMDFLVDNCNTVKNPHGYYPNVDEKRPFKLYDSALDFLVAQEWCAYVEDTAVWTEKELLLPSPPLQWFERLNLVARNKRIVASQMEKHHARIFLRFLDEHGNFRREILEAVSAYLAQWPERKKWMIVCQHKEVAEALYRIFDGNTWLITGDTTNIDPVCRAFIEAEGGWLIGTTALAEGVDGLDKVCQSMLILDPIWGDDSKRRQIIGRILPRGTGDEVERIVVEATF